MILSHLGFIHCQKIYSWYFVLIVLVNLSPFCFHFSNDIWKLCNTLYHVGPTDEPDSASTFAPTKQMLPYSDDIISFFEVDIITPAQKKLARKLTFHILPGRSLLVTGKCGL